MIEKGSRYEHTRLFQQADDGYAFGGIRPRQITTVPGVIEYTVKQGDRLDLLALNFYNDTRHWWRIVDANPHIMFAGELMLDAYAGQVIVIPRAAARGAV